MGDKAFERKLTSCGYFSASIIVPSYVEALSSDINTVGWVILTRVIFESQTFIHNVILSLLQAVYILF